MGVSSKQSKTSDIIPSDNMPLVAGSCQHVSGCQIIMHICMKSVYGIQFGLLANLLMIALEDFKEEIVIAVKASLYDINFNLQEYSMSMCVKDVLIVNKGFSTQC